MSAPWTGPAEGLYADVVGQDRAVAILRAAAAAPVHAYLLHGPPGSGSRTAARVFAASLLCPTGGCGVCDHCRRALAGTHPDLVVVERTGAALAVDDARTVVTRAQRRPMEADRQVLLIADAHLAVGAAPALLKTIEEPPKSTVFVLLADELPASLATIASRCVLVPFEPLSPAVVAAWLEARGVAAPVAASVAEGAGGDLDRALLLATDDGFAARRTRWREVPERLDGTGAAAAATAAELAASLDEAVEPLRRAHAEELAELVERAEAMGAKTVPGRKEIEERQHREERRYRTDDFRAGLAVLAGAYRDRLVAQADVERGSGGAAELRRVAGAVDSIGAAARALGRNPNEALLLEALLVSLSGMEA